MIALGLDTSNYTTSAAFFDGEGGYNAGKLLEVKPGEKGLRQSDALFQHVKALPNRMAQLRDQGLGEITAIAASTRPRAVEGSYMPCFLAGESLGRSMASALNIPFFEVSHQQGHLAAAAWSSGRMELLDAPFLAWHLSGGTTELLHVEPDGVNVRARRIGGTTDISAGQLMDRTGVLLGLAFPAGKALDELSHQCESWPKPFPRKLTGLEFSLSGVENKVGEMMAKGEPPEAVVAFAVGTMAQAVCEATVAAQNRYPGLPLLCSGGVASNSHLRYLLTEHCGAVFAPPQYSTDNAMGVAVLCHRLWTKNMEE
ncbi:MAG: DNA-binding protein [Oscillospiraceae bacterium]|nr:DNA-binding protein [Oscillospiraceae bacterium]